MKKLLMLGAIFCLLFQAITISAATPDFSGEWELDINKSKLPETIKVESMTLKISQTKNELKVEMLMKRDAARRGDNAQTVVYNLDGTETTAAIGSGMTAGSETRKAKLTPDGKLSLTVARRFKTATGDSEMKINDTLELLDNGQALKMIRYTESARGGTNWELFFTKKSAAAANSNDAVADTEIVAADKTANGEISGGVLNGKAVVFPKPAYPPAARAVKASGAVNVKVTIDEQGDVVSASAISGHPLLRQAAEEAARGAKFAPTTLSGQPVKITGVIVYNFVP